MVWLKALQNGDMFSWQNGKLESASLVADIPDQLPLELVERSKTYPCIRKKTASRLEVGRWTRLQIDRWPDRKRRCRREPVAAKFDCAVSIPISEWLRRRD